MSSLMYKTCWVFDLDGTLVDSFPMLAAAMGDVLQEASWPMPPEALLRASLSQGLAAMFDCARLPLSAPSAVAPADGAASLASSPLSDADWAVLRQRYLARYESHYLPQTRTFAGVNEVLHAFRQRGLSLAVCTNRDQHTSQLLLDQLGLSALMDHLVALDDMGERCKPAPDGLLRIAHALGQPVTALAFVGDSGIDCQTAQAAGVGFHAHLKGYHAEVGELMPNEHAFSDYMSWLHTLLAQGLPSVRDARV